MTTKSFLKAGIIGAFLSAVAAQSVFALPANMITSGATNPPVGHYEFCRTLPQECRANPGSTAPLTLTREGWKKILEVNYDVNESVAPLTDKEIYGVEEYWAYPDKVGDCEDYVLLKRKRLMQAGFSPSDLLITVVLQPNGDGHAVLTVRTDRGDFVLDNMRNKVLLWSETEYQFLKRQSTRNAAQWVKIEDDHSPAVGSLQ